MAVIIHERELALRAVSPRIIANDSVLTPQEKPMAVQSYNIILAEQPGLDSQAALYGITTERVAYDNAVTALVNYLATLTGWNIIPGTNVPIVGTTYRGYWEAVYTTKQALQNAINTAINGSLGEVTPPGTPLPPVSAIASSEPFGIRITVVESPSTYITHYEYRVGTVAESATVIEPAGGSSYLWQVQTTGTYTFWIYAVNSLGNLSTPVSASITIAGGSITGLANAISGTEMFLQWNGIAGSFAISGYDIRYGTSWASATLVDIRQVTTYKETVTWIGTRTYWVTPIDAKGNYGTPASTIVTVLAPTQVTGARAEVVDNNVLLYWNPSVVGFNQLEVAYYDVRKGTTYAGGTTVGSNGNSTFGAIFEQSSGTYTYWIAPVDSANNTGTAVSIVATVNQPPDYKFSGNYNSTFDGADPPSLAVTNTLTNFYYERGYLLGPVDTTDSWAQHYIDNGYTTPAAQVAAGYPIYNNPSLTTGSYEEILDYGTTIPATIITVTLNTELITGSVPYTVTISHKVNIGDSWTVLTAGVTNALIPQFRYIRIQVNATASAGANLLKITGLNVTLAVKLRNDSGEGSASVGGSTVNFNYPFISADTPIVQPKGSTPRIPVVTYAGGTNPTSFTVQIFSLAGTDVGGDFSWTVRGY